MITKQSSLISCRNQFGTLCDQLGYKIGVEIGVDTGRFSNYLLSRSTNLTLYSIDPWLPYAEIPEPRNVAKSKAYTTLANYGQRSIILEVDSLKASEIISDQVDFVYIDGAHDYVSVYQDIKIWKEKIRKGGMLSGHDFDLNSVIMAVDEHFSDKVVYLVGETKDPDCWAHPSWYVFID